ncbi:MAG TPA: hypothetical protein PKC39_09460 [Ferruginibacter sp.]|nr:hypothetical protein [Ferruginibacter sp.]HMP21174.1 hypothetical protein [Ferruginibacter sp.]
MKKTVFLSLLLASLTASVQLNAQAPDGFVNGTVTLSGGSVMNGYVKDNMKKGAAITFADNSGNKQLFDGSEIAGVELNGVQFICIKGDFFKVITSGKLYFLQKASNASGKPVFNGSEAIFASGTSGKIGDYFVYSNEQLTHLTKKTAETFINEKLVNCPPALEKAQAGNGEIAALSEAIAIYNSNNP